jgi:hypothetical protein
MRERYVKATTVSKKEAIILAFVDTLKQSGLLSHEIESVLNIEMVLDSQGNRQMMSNNAAYKVAVNKALGKK